MNYTRKTSTDHGDKTLASPWLVNMLITGVALIVITILSYGFYTGDRMNRMYAPLVDAAMEIKQGATIAHLLFEEIMSGDGHGDIQMVWKYQDQAEWYAQAMIAGGENSEGIFLPLHDAEMRRKIKEVQEKLKKLRVITQKMLEMKSRSGAGSDIDQRHDAVFWSFLKDADEVETKLQQVMVKDLSSFRYIQGLLAVLVILLFFSISIVFHRFERGRMNAFRSIREVKKNLEIEICERKLVEEALTKSETRYRGIFEESPISLWEEDFSAVKIYIDQLHASGVSDFRSYFERHPETVTTCIQLVKIIDINRETLNIFQADNKELLLENLDMIFGKKYHEAFKKELIYLAEGRYKFELQTFNKTLKGNELQIMLGLTVVAGYEDTWSKVLVSLFDVTKRMETEAELAKYRDHLEELVQKRTEELKEKTEKVEKSSKALTCLMEDVNLSREELQQVNSEYIAANKELKEFAYIVSHDLKAPLRAISQLTHWIAEDYSTVFDADAKEQMDLILNRVKRMDALIDGVLRYSRVGRVKEKEEELDLNILLKEVIDTIAAPNTVQISVATPLPVVSRDPTRMAQIFQNLIENGVKYMDKAEGRIQVGCVDKGTLWEFTVSDNGPGIDKRYQEKIFQIFQTLMPRDERESTGIGLTLVKKIISLYGGSVWVESEIGKGSTFFFTLSKNGEADEKI